MNGLGHTLTMVFFAHSQQGFIVFGQFVNSQMSLLGYAAAASAFFLLLGGLFTVWRERMRGSVLTAASLAAAAWAAYLAVTAAAGTASIGMIFLVEMLHDTVWLFFLASLLGSSVAVESNWLVRRGGIALGLSLLVAATLLEFAGLHGRFPNMTGQLLVTGSIGTSLFGLVGIEQLYRNVRQSQKNGIKFLCLGLGGIFAFDLLLYSNAVFDGQIRPQFWAARGYVVALCVPLIAISVRRNMLWRRGIFASRQVVFYTTTLFAAGAYLTAIGLAGYYVRTLGREWGDALQLIIVCGGIIGLLALVMSEQVRGRARVWLTKHFFERKYDYRAEWMRLIYTLTSTASDLPLKKRAIKALSQIVDSRSGHLWLRSENDKEFLAVASWDTQPLVAKISATSKLAAFLARKGWIVDVLEIESNPGKYEPLSRGDLPEQLATTAYIVPLAHESELIGFVSLAAPKTATTLNFEDHDLLKTAGQQIASYLTQEGATEQLAESRQFEAFNRFTAFVMHDLKNAVAQQSLVVENAERHKRNPEFIDDAMDTIRGSVKRMRRVMRHLRQSAVDQQTERVDVTKVLLEVVSQCSDRNPVPDLSAPDHAVIVRGNRQRLSAAIDHAVRNAQDASNGDGSVELNLEVVPDACRLLVSDTGCGMDADFVRDRLFRPFDSTKGSEGMGIGAYQIRETLRACGGELEVVSELDVGTTLTMIIPLAKAGPA